MITVSWLFAHRHPLPPCSRCHAPWLTRLGQGIVRCMLCNVVYKVQS